MQNSMEQWMDLGTAYTVPMQQLNRISSDLMERVRNLQSHALEDCLDTNMEQLRVFGECRDPSEFLQRESELFNGALERMRKRSEEAMAVFSETQQDFGQLFREGLMPPAKAAPKSETKAAKSGGEKAAATAKEAG